MSASGLLLAALERTSIVYAVYGSQNTDTAKTVWRCQGARFAMHSQQVGGAEPT